MQSAFRPDLLAGKKVFVTGGGTSMGKEIVLAYMQHGADAAIMGRRREKLEEAKAELEAKTGRTCHVCQGDVRDVEQVKAAVEAAVTALGQIDVLVNGAAGNYFAALDKLSYRAYKTVIRDQLTRHFQRHQDSLRADYEAHWREHHQHHSNPSLHWHYGPSSLCLREGWS
jgi:peroxisomal 2,4-dienoyl-CoA reductase